MGKILKTRSAGGPIDYFSLALGVGLEGWEVIRAMGLAMQEGSYQEFNLGKRTVYEAPRNLAFVQKKLAEWIKPMDIGDSIAYEGFNIREKLEPLVDYEVLLTTDVVRFFDNIGYSSIFSVLKNTFEDEASKILATIFTMNKNGRRFLPQGGVASPFVANRVAAVMLDPVIRACLPSGAYYVRYCDNIIIGLEEEDSPEALLLGLRSIVCASGFRLHKSNIRRSHQRQKALGLVLNEVVNVPRQYVDDVRATLHNVCKTSWEEQAGNVPVELFKARVLGKARYIIDNSTSSRAGRVRSIYEKLT